MIINGIAKIGFNIIGIPNITGSLILNILGPIDNLAICFISSRFPMIKIANSNPIVTPEPPIFMYISQKGILIIFGISFPALNASVFSAIEANNNGSRIGLII